MASPTAATPAIGSIAPAPTPTHIRRTDAAPNPRPSRAVEPAAIAPPAAAAAAGSIDHTTRPSSAGEALPKALPTALLPTALPTGVVFATSGVHHGKQFPIVGYWWGGGSLATIDHVDRRRLVASTGSEANQRRDPLSRPYPDRRLPRPTSETRALPKSDSHRPAHLSPRSSSSGVVSRTTAARWDRPPAPSAAPSPSTRDGDDDDDDGGGGGDDRGPPRTQRPGPKDAPRSKATRPPPVGSGSGKNLVHDEELSLSAVLSWALACHYRDGGRGGGGGAVSGTGRGWGGQAPFAVYMRVALWCRGNATATMYSNRHIKVHLGNMKTPTATVLPRVEGGGEEVGRRGGRGGVSANETKTKQKRDKKKKKKCKDSRLNYVFCFPTKIYIHQVHNTHISSIIALYSRVYVYIYIHIYSKYIYIYFMHCFLLLASFGHTLTLAVVPVTVSCPSSSRPADDGSSSDCAKSAGTYSWLAGKGASSTPSLW